MMRSRIHVAVRLFAAPREALGRDGMTVDLPAGTTVGALLDRLATEHPALVDYRPYLQVAVNRRVVGVQTTLQDGDEAALLPPVGGG